MWREKLTGVNVNKVLGTAQIREKGQITIPQAVRDYLKIKQGEKIAWIWEQGKVVIKKEKANYENFEIEP